MSIPKQSIKENECKEITLSLTMNRQTDDLLWRAGKQKEEA